MWTWLTGRVSTLAGLGFGGTDTCATGDSLVSAETVARLGSGLWPSPLSVSGPSVRVGIGDGETTLAVDGSPGLARLGALGSSFGTGAALDNSCFCAATLGTFCGNASPSGALGGGARTSCPVNWYVAGGVGTPFGRLAFGANVRLFSA